MAILEQTAAVAPEMLPRIKDTLRGDGAGLLLLQKMVKARIKGAQDGVAVSLSAPVSATPRISGNTLAL